MADFRTMLANSGLGLVLNSLFRASYSPQAMRTSFELVAGISAESLQRKYPQVRITAEVISGVPTETISVSGGEKKTILYLHGGAYFMGSIAAYRRNALRIANSCHANVILAEYRLAPEHPFPAGLDDSLAVYAALTKRVPQNQLVVAGDSAGGGLALATVLRARDENLSLPSAVFCLSAWTDLTNSLPSWVNNAEKEVWLTPAHSNKWAQQYAQGKDLRNPYLSPFFGDFRGFPPTLLLVGDQESLLDDSRMVVEKINAAGGKATLETGRNMQHVWPLFLPFLPEGKKALVCLEKFVASAQSPT